MKPRYNPLRCQTCGRYDSYDIFDEGMDGEVNIRIMGDFGHTDDRIFVISSRFLDVLTSIQAKGYETKALGESGWHAFKITRLVQLVPNLVQFSGPVCSSCGRADDAFRLVQFVGQIEAPDEPNTFFASLKAHPYFRGDRQIFLTEDIALALKQAKIKGGYCKKVLSNEEWSKLPKDSDGCLHNWPRGSIVYL